MKILLVDDEEGILEQAKIFLEKEINDLKVETVCSVKDGLEKLEKRKFDAVVSDYQMPGTDGLELLEILREEKNDDIPFIMFTGKSREEVAIEALNLGANRYLQKGGDPNSQYGVLAQAIEQEVQHWKTIKEKERVKAELSSVVKGSSDPIYIVDRDFRIVFANQAELEKVGMEFGEIIGSKFEESHPEVDTRKFRKFVKKVFKSGESQRYEVEYSGKGRYYDKTLSPIRNPQTGNINKVAIIAKDVTNKKNLEKKLCESEEKYRKQFEEAMDSIFIANAKNGDIIDCNKAAVDLIGRNKSEIIGEHLKILHPESESEKPFGEIFKKHVVEKSGEVLETEIITKSGEIKNVAIKGSLIEINDKKLLQGIFRDITKEKKREKNF